MPHKPPHVAYVAWGFAPARTGGVYRAVATANELAAQGFRVTVLTVDPAVYEEFLGTDESLAGVVDANVSIERLPFPWPTREADVRRFSRSRALLGSRLWNRRYLKKQMAVFPEPNYGAWLPIAANALRELHQRDPVDITVATANPHVDFAVAHDLWASHQVPYVMDYRDAWRLDVFSGDTMEPRTGPVGELEATYLAHAHAVWFVNDAILDWHAHEYPQHAHKMRSVENGWDEHYVGNRTQPRKLACDPLTFGYLGTVTPKVPLEQLMQAWIQAKNFQRIPSDAVLKVGGYLGYFGNPRADLKKVLDDASDAGVEFLGAVPKAQATEFYNTCDVLVLALGTGRYVTSGKVYEYCSTGKPIVSVHEPTNDATRVLAEYPLHVATKDLSVDAIAHALAEAAHMAHNATTAELGAAFAAGTQWNRSHQLAPAVAALHEAVSVS